MSTTLSIKTQFPKESPFWNPKLFWVPREYYSVYCDASCSITFLVAQICSFTKFQNISHISTSFKYPSNCSWFFFLFNLRKTQLDISIIIKVYQPSYMFLTAQKGQTLPSHLSAVHLSIYTGFYPVWSHYLVASLQGSFQRTRSVTVTYSHVFHGMSFFKICILGTSHKN